MKTLPKVRSTNGLNAEDLLLTERAELEREAFRAIGFYKKARLQLGRIFNRLKATVEHGRWEQYFETTFGHSCVSFRTGQRYMKAASRDDREFKNQSVMLFKAGNGSHARVIRNATENAKVVQAISKVPAKIYRLPLELTPDQLQATTQLWASSYRRAAEEAVVASLNKQCAKYGFSTQKIVKSDTGGGKA